MVNLSVNIISESEGFEAQGVHTAFLDMVEALTLRTPVIASNIPVHLELAEGVATLLDPLDGPAWIDAIEAAAAASARGPAYAAPTWDAHFGLIADALRTLT